MYYVVVYPLLTALWEESDLPSSHPQGLTQFVLNLVDIIQLQYFVLHYIVDAVAVQPRACCIYLFSLYLILSVDFSLFQAMPLVVKQLQLLWSPRIIGLLFEQLFTYSEVSEHSITQSTKGNPNASKSTWYLFLYTIH